MAKRMAKKPAGKSAAARDDSYDDDDVAGADGGATFDAEKFLAHVDNVRGLKSKAASIRGDIGAAVKNAEEDYGIHRGASALWIKLEGMADEQRDAFLKAFDDMRIALGRAHQTDLFAGGSPAEAATFAGRT